MTLSKQISRNFRLFLAGVFVLCGVAPLRAQVPRPVNFLAEHYDVSASLDPAGQAITAAAKIDFRAIEASSILRVELHQNLEVKSVKSADGKSLNFERDSASPLNLTVSLPSQVATN